MVALLGFMEEMVYGNVFNMLGRKEVGAKGKVTKSLLVPVIMCSVKLIQFMDLRGTTLPKFVVLP